MLQSYVPCASTVAEHFELFGKQRHQEEWGMLPALAADQGTPFPQQGSGGKYLPHLCFKAKQLHFEKKKKNLFRVPLGNLGKDSV